MRKVIRGKQPDSLKNHAAQWTSDLLDEIERTGCFAKVPDLYKMKYNQQDVKDALRMMYKNHCCYCEGLLGVQTYGRIEHLRPKSLPQFYDLTFDWNNLHWCCEICNTTKKTKWDDAAPILDPTVDDITHFLVFNPDTGEYEALNGNKRAKTTIDHTGMNRNKLVEARRKMVVKLVKIYHYMEPSVNNMRFLDEIMKTYETDSFPSVVEAVVRELRVLESEKQR